MLWWIFLFIFPRYKQAKLVNVYPTLKAWLINNRFLIDNIYIKKNKRQTRVRANKSSEIKHGRIRIYVSKAWVIPLFIKRKLRLKLKWISNKSCQDVKTLPYLHYKMTMISLPTCFYGLRFYVFIFSVY